MVKLDLDQILETTETIVQELLATGEFGHCTFKDVLFRVDARLELPHGTMLRYKHKSTVKDLIRNLLQTDEPDEQILSPSKKRLPTRPESKVGGKRTKRRKSNAEESDEGDSDEEPEPKKAKKSSSSSKVKAKEVKADKVSKREPERPGIKSTASGKKSKAAISSELVDSDIDDTDPGPSTSKPSASTPSPKKSKQKLIESDSEDDVTEAFESTKPLPSQKQPKAEKIPEAKDMSGDKSESELSVLFDDEPQKPRRKVKGEKDETKSKSTRQKKEKKELSKDEETIKRLKSFVVACGVRKVWSKEFKDLNSPSAQISRLKSILADLGMTGRMSMEQAKAVKAKREFAQELEDVKDFEKKFIGRSEGRSSRRKLGSPSRSDVESSDEDEDEDEEDDKPRKKRVNARNSINAFLEDQSDGD